MPSEIRHLPLVPSWAARWQGHSPGAMSPNGDVRGPRTLTPRRKDRPPGPTNPARPPDTALGPCRRTGTLGVAEHLHAIEDHASGALVASDPLHMPACRDDTV